MSEHDDGSITPAGRFARMEAALIRIEEKLDAKADTARVEALEVTLDAMESRFNDYLTGRVMTPSGQEYLRRFQEMEANIVNLEKIGSPGARAAMDAVQRLDSRIDVLEQGESNRMAVASALRETADVRYRSLLWMVGIASLLNVAIAILSFILSHFQ